MKTGIKDTDGIDFGYKFVQKCTAYQQLNVSGPTRVTGGSLWLWGDNESGILGRNKEYAAIPECERISPAQTVAGGNNWKTAAMSNIHAGGIKTDGTLWLWGRNLAGSIGDGTLVSKSSPVQTSSGGTNWKSLTLGKARPTSAAIKIDGTLWAWGPNTCAVSGVTGGVFDNTCLSVPSQVTAPGSAWSKISHSGTGAAAIRADGSLWWWGLGMKGTYTGCAYCPTQLTLAGCGWKEVATNTNTVAAIKNDGTLWTLGCHRGRANDSLTATGRLSSPVQDSTGSNDWKKVFGYSCACTNPNLSNGFAALKCDGTLWGWAGPMCRLLIASGEFAYKCPYRPVLNITGCSKWRDISLSQRCGVGIKEDGTLWGWGNFPLERSLLLKSNRTGYYRCHFFSPVQIAPDKKGWRLVDASFSNMLGILQED